MDNLINNLLNTLDPEPWRVEYCGGFYEIKFDSQRQTELPHPPRWYVQRMDNLMVSERYYSRAAGAFLALSSGAIKWEK